MLIPFDLTNINTNERVATFKLVDFVFVIKNIHHINFVVHDLDTAVSRYQKVLGLGFSRRDELPDRGVITARAKLGETWLILVQPTHSDSEPGRYLAEHGEGFFLISYEVDDLLGAADDLVGKGVTFAQSEPRTGLDDWRVMDVNPDETCGVLTQLVSERT